MNRILQMAAAQGIDVNFATGATAMKSAVGFITVDFPASSPLPLELAARAWR
jgi:hypothetical protein